MKQETLDMRYYYDYDRDFPLEAYVDTLGDRLFHITYYSVNGKRVPALLSLPKARAAFYPVILMLHGIGDHKNADYMQIGDSIFSAAGFAVFRLDIDLHGERRLKNFSQKSANKFSYTLRNAMVQTVFDLRRAVDYLDTRDDIDSTRTAFLGISLGGIIGSVFCGVEPRVEYPMIALAGGGLRMALGTEGLSDRITNMLAPVEPLNFIHRITPRPILFLNATDDEVIPRTSTEMLFNAAKEPKQILWYKAPHHMPPVPVFQDCVRWLKEQFAD
ncbi:MAG: acetylxylan esterase [candidate division KSB1 bacterium]|nr:acetylxylan esterase [candidate division KSB1 bacterium]